MYLATGDARFKQRADYLVREMKEVQDKNGDGYLERARERPRGVRRGLARATFAPAAFDLNGLWSPWYTLHKTFAGLRDAYRHTGNKTALDVETQVRRVGRGRAQAAQRRAGCEDAQHRARRHERGARPISTSTPATSAGSTSRIASSITRSPMRSSATRTTSPASTATVRSRS